MCVLFLRQSKGTLHRWIKNIWFSQTTYVHRHPWCSFKRKKKTSTHNKNKLKVLFLHKLNNHMFWRSLSLGQQAAEPRSVAPILGWANSLWDSRTAAGLWLRERTVSFLGIDREQRKRERYVSFCEEDIETAGRLFLKKRGLLLSMRKRERERTLSLSLSPEKLLAFAVRYGLSVLLLNLFEYPWS